MNGIHDMGGMDGFGEVQPQDSEAFHELWEKQIFVANRLVRTPSLNEGRSTEYMDPVDYLGWGYFGRSLHSLERKRFHGAAFWQQGRQWRPVRRSPLRASRKNPKGCMVPHPQGLVFESSP